MIANEIYQAVANLVGQLVELIAKIFNRSPEIVGGSSPVSPQRAEHRLIEKARGIRFIPRVEIAVQRRKDPV
jgi:hypothetical protein